MSSGALEVKGKLIERVMCCFYASASCLRWEFIILNWSERAFFYLLLNFAFPLSKQGVNIEKQIYV